MTLSAVVFPWFKSGTVLEHVYQKPSPSSLRLLLLELVGRQALQIQRFPRFSRASDAIRVPSAPLLTALGGECPLAKRCVRAVKSFEALFGILLGRFVDSSNVTWVQPARFRQSALVMARVLGLAEGHQTRHT